MFLPPPTQLPTQPRHLLTHTHQPTLQPLSSQPRNKNMFSGWQSTGTAVTQKQNGKQLLDSESILVLWVKSFVLFSSKHLIESYIFPMLLPAPAQLPTQPRHLPTHQPTQTDPPTLRPQSSYSCNIENMFFRVAKYGVRFNPQMKWKAAAG